MKKHIILLLPFVIVVGAVAGAVSYSRKSVARGSGLEAPVVAAEHRAWGGDHLSFEMHAPDDADAKKFGLSEVFADLPPEIVRRGGVVHLVVTQPEWTVFDSANHVAEGGDGVLLVAR